MWVLVGFNGGHNDVTFKARPLCNLTRCTALWKCDITDRSKAARETRQRPLQNGTPGNS